MSTSGLLSTRSFSASCVWASLSGLASVFACRALRTSLETYFNVLFKASKRGSNSATEGSFPVEFSSFCADATSTKTETRISIKPWSYNKETSTSLAETKQSSKPTVLSTIPLSTRWVWDCRIWDMVRRSFWSTTVWMMSGLLSKKDSNSLRPYAGKGSWSCRMRWYWGSKWLLITYEKSMTTSTLPLKKRPSLKTPDAKCFY